MKWVGKNMRQAQIGLLVVLWVLIGTNVQLIFEVPFYDFPVLVYSIYILCLVLFNFWVSYKIFHVPIIWVRVLLLLIVSTLLYGIGFFLLVFPLKYFIQIYADIPMVVRWHERAFVNAHENLFSLVSVGWMIEFIYFPFILYSCGFMMMKHMAAVNKKADLLVLNAGLELENLKNQFHPHFLFNTLNNIYGLVMTNEQAGDAVLKLSGLLRFSLYESKEDRIPLSREIRFLEDYIHLEKIRHHEHVSIDFEVTVEDDDSPIAPLLLITFVENAFKHGVNSSIRNSWVKINLRQQENIITFEVSNSKPAKGSKKEGPGGIGLENVKRRLTLLYPQKHELVVSDQQEVFSLTFKITT
ncbi:sensor histidine kinase [Litoribacter populi]|uniref:sensor histidine kinase n=1 Tax=Litoribacter populi TaxID=2598460 RepID=UPI00117E32A0|nr:histidine kinase [Litoribacter populi]